MIIRFEPLEDFRGWQRAPDFLRFLIAENDCKHILEIGSGANPTLEPEYVQTKGLHYVTSDPNEAELAKADPAFERLVLDLSSAVPSHLLGSFDCVFSRMVLEHIREGEEFHRNIFKILPPGGIAVHCFSSLWTVPFAANRLFPDLLTNLLLRYFNPRDEHRHAKFKAYYSWGRGPTKTMIDRFHSLGFEIVEYVGCFGHPYYRKRFPWLEHFEKMKTAYLLRHPIPQLCSYATVILRKPMRNTIGH